MPPPPSRWLPAKMTLYAVTRNFFIPPPRVIPQLVMFPPVFPPELLEKIHSMCAIFLEQLGVKKAKRIHIPPHITVKNTHRTHNMA